ncbi:MAG: hypothetical protein SGJ27_25675 [Candidatus Melainabacteria bacterium]|nr:hypothetical protein [Candidatus Melainabacteria bacterium]
MDEKTRRQNEQAALARSDREREERRKREEIERRRRAEDHERFRMQQMAVEKQHAGRKEQELEISKANDALLDSLDLKKRQELMQEFQQQQASRLSQPPQPPPSPPQKE